MCNVVGCLVSYSEVRVDLHKKVHDNDVKKKIAVSKRAALRQKKTVDAMLVMK